MQDEKEGETLLKLAPSFAAAWCCGDPSFAVAVDTDGDVKVSRKEIFDDMGDVASLRGEFVNASKDADEDGIFKVKATAGDTHLEGEDFDSRIVDICMVATVLAYFSRILSARERRMRGLSRV